MDLLIDRLGGPDTRVFAPPEKHVGRSETRRVRADADRRGTTGVPTDPEPAIAIAVHRR